VDKKIYWTNVTVFSLFIGYTGYYLCRTNLSIATPLIIKTLGYKGIDKETLGNIGSLGVMAYAIGKLLNGIIGDFIGGKKIFIFGMVGSIIATILFGFSSGIIWFSVLWFLNRLIQSMGWGGLVKMTSNWIDYKKYGKVMGILSLSYLFGDIVARLFFGKLINIGFTWQMLFFMAAAMLGLILVFNLFFLKDSPAQLNLPMPETNPENLFLENENNGKSQSLKELLLPYFKNPSFYFLLIMSFGLTAIREAFNFWTPTYLHEVAKLKEGDASQASSLYLIAGGISIILCGWVSDAIFKGKRGVLIAISCVPMAIILYLMTFPFETALISILLMALTGFFLLGPYSFLAGAMSLDFGGRKGAATAVGLIDSFGYVGGTIAVKLTGHFSEKYGWSSSFLMLSIIAIITAITAIIYYRIKERKLIYS